MPENQIHLPALRFGAVINAASGGTDDSTQEKLEAIFEESRIQGARIWRVEAGGLDTALTEALAAGLDVLVVIGGDGTIRSAAERSTMDGPILIPLPGGTMNMLPKALYGDLGWEEALRLIFKDPFVRTLSGGKIGKEQFVIAAILGAPALWTKAREALREGELVTALEESQHALDSMFASKINYTFNELHTGSAEAVSVICPLISTTLADDREVLEAAVIDLDGAAGVLELAGAAAFGEWRDSQNVGIVHTKSVTVTSDQEIPIIASGENFEDKKNFLKKIGSNPLLAKRALHFFPKKSWEILLNSWDSATPATLTRASREPNFGLHTNWLDMVAEIGTFWKLDPLAAYLPNLKDGLYPVVRPTREELARV